MVPFSMILNNPNVYCFKGTPFMQRLVSKKWYNIVTIATVTTDHQWKVICELLSVPLSMTLIAFQTDGQTDGQTSCDVIVRANKTSGKKFKQR